MSDLWLKAKKAELTATLNWIICALKLVWSLLFCAFLHFFSDLVILHIAVHVQSSFSFTLRALRQNTFHQMAADVRQVGPEPKRIVFIACMLDLTYDGLKLLGCSPTYRDHNPNFFTSSSCHLDFLGFLGPKLLKANSDKFHQRIRPWMYSTRHVCA